MTKWIRTVRCHRLARLPGFPGCCDSCHDDEEEGYGRLPGGEDISPYRCREYELCCRVGRWVSENFSKSSERKWLKRHGITRDEMEARGMLKPLTEGYPHADEQPHPECVDSDTIPQA